MSCRTSHFLSLGLPCRPSHLSHAGCYLGALRFLFVLSRSPCSCQLELRVEGTMTVTECPEISGASSTASLESLEVVDFTEQAACH